MKNNQTLDGVANHAAAGVPARNAPSNGYASFTGERGIDRSVIGNFGNAWLSRNLRVALAELADEIEFTVYSYATPIAFKIRGQWLVIDERHSTTSGRHVRTISQYIGWQKFRHVMPDATAADILRIADGLMTYVPEHRKPGRLVAA